MHARKALEKVGAPVDLMQCIKKTSHAKTARRACGHVGLLFQRIGSFALQGSMLVC